MRGLFQSIDVKVRSIFALLLFLLHASALSLHKPAQGILPTLLFIHTFREGTIRCLCIGVREGGFYVVSLCFCLSLGGFRLLFPLLLTDSKESHRVLPLVSCSAPRNDAARFGHPL